MMAISIILLTIPACVDEDPVTPSTRRQWSLTTLPTDSIAEHPDMVEIAKQLPAFGGMYFDDAGDLVVALTDVAHRPGRGEAD